MMDEPLAAKGMEKLVEAKICVKPEKMRGPLEPG
jgi:hypothetical protein